MLQKLGGAMGGVFGELPAGEEGEDGEEEEEGEEVVNVHTAASDGGWGAGGAEQPASCAQVEQ